MGVSHLKVLDPKKWCEEETWTQFVVPEWSRKKSIPQFYIPWKNAVVKNRIPISWAISKSPKQRVGFHPFKFNQTWIFSTAPLISSLWAIADWVLRGFTVNIRNPPTDWHAPWSRPMKTPLVAGDPAHMCIFLIDPRKKVSLGLHDHQSSRVEKCTNRSTHLRLPRSWNSWKKVKKNLQSEVFAYARMIHQRRNNDTWWGKTHNFAICEKSTLNIVVWRTDPIAKEIESSVISVRSDSNFSSTLRGSVT